MRITGYTYKADVYCGGCLIERLIRDGDASTVARKVNDVERTLDAIAGAKGIDRYDESTFDSGDFPKVIFSTDDDGERCGNCGGELR